MLVGHLYIFLKEYLFRSFAHFSIVVLVFLLLSCISCLYILDTKAKIKAKVKPMGPNQTDKLLHSKGKHKKTKTKKTKRQHTKWEQIVPFRTFNYQEFSFCFSLRTKAMFFLQWVQPCNGIFFFFGYDRYPLRI